MGTPQQEAVQPAPPKAPPVVIVPPEMIAGTDLERELNRLEAAKARVTEAEQERDRIIMEIKNQGVRLATAVSGGKEIPPSIRFPGAPGRIGWTLTWTVTRRFDTKAFEAAEPALYEKWRKPKGGWVLGPEG